MDSAGFQPFVIVFHTHRFVVLLVGHPRIPSHLLNRLDSQAGKDCHHEHVDPCPVARKFLIFKRTLFKENGIIFLYRLQRGQILAVSVLLRVKVVEVRAERQHQLYDGVVNGEFQEAPLKEQVEVPVIAAMRGPVLHVQFAD